MFPRRIGGAPVLFPEEFRYAQDYALWWRLCRLGAVACPPHIVYRHRRHESSVSTARRHEQDDCALRIRREYQSTFLSAPASSRLASEVSRFWTTEGRPAGESTWRPAYSALLEIRARFLIYVADRYGSDAKTRLECELDWEIRDRLAHWVFRASKALDLRSCGELLSIVETHELRDVAARALSKAARALIGKFPVADTMSAPVRNRSELPIEAAKVALK